MNEVTRNRGLDGRNKLKNLSQRRALLLYLEYQIVSSFVWIDPPAPSLASVSPPWNRRGGGHTDKYTCWCRAIRLKGNKIWSKYRLCLPFTCSFKGAVDLDFAHCTLINVQCCGLGDPDPGPKSHFDSDPDPDPTPSFTHTGKSEFF